jgi:hypothetical protein
MCVKVRQSFFWAVGGLQVFELLNLRVVTVYNEKHGHCDSLKEVYQTKVEDVRSGFLEHTCNRDSLDAPVVLRFILECRQVFFNFEESTSAREAFTIIDLRVIVR